MGDVPASTASGVKVICGHCDKEYEYEYEYSHQLQIFIVYNGPIIREADKVLREALDLHFAQTRDGWHFSTNTVFKISGLTEDKILKRKNKMDIY